MPKNDGKARATKLKAHEELESLRCLLADRYGSCAQVDAMDFAVRTALHWVGNPDSFLAVHFARQAYVERTADAYIAGPYAPNETIPMERVG